MKNTALRAWTQSADNTHMVFTDKEHGGLSVCPVGRNETIDKMSNFGGIYCWSLFNLGNRGSPGDKLVSMEALRRIIRDCNQEILEKEPNGNNSVLLPRFSCHILRHTFATRLCEAGVNMKVIQDVLGHADISTTMNIYTDATKELKERELSSYSEYLAQYAEKEKQPDDMVIEIRTVGK